MTTDSALVTWIGFLMAAFVVASVMGVIIIILVFVLMLKLILRARKDI